MTVPPLLCEHPQEKAKRHGFRLVCGVCGSFWDLESRAAHVEYDASYPAERGHLDPHVGELKVRTLKHSIAEARVSHEGRHGCEGGFGRRNCLPFVPHPASPLVSVATKQQA